MKSFIFCTHPQMLLCRSNQGEWDGRDMWHGMGQERNAYRIFVGKSKGNRPLGRPRRRWEQNGDGLGECRLNLGGSGQGPVGGCCECGDEPSGPDATELVNIKIQTRASLKTFILRVSVQNPHYSALMPALWCYCVIFFASLHARSSSRHFLVL
jgi:hypothetical protein